MMNKSKIARAIAMAMTGTALSAAGISAASAATTMYNTYTTVGENKKNANPVNLLTANLNTNTDGWTYIGADTALDPDNLPSGWESNGNSGTVVPWLGTTGGARPFGYTGSSHLNWAVSLSGVGDSAEISAADSTARYSEDANYTHPAEIDTGGGAWRDTSNPTTGWKHQTDIGLIKSDVKQNVTLNLTALGALSPTFAKFGVTVFEGMDTNTGNYSHHGGWNNPSASKPYTMDNPFGTTGLTNNGYSDNVDAVTGFTFLAEAGKVYSIYLGGVDFSAWNTGLDNYKLSITTSAVPVPAAVWLFGSALAGMGIIGRRKNKGALVA